MEGIWMKLAMEALAAVLCALCGWLGMAVRRYVNTETKRTVAAAAVEFAEQVWQELHGEDKLEKALEAAQTLLSKRGIPFDREEMRILIEAAVGRFNEQFKG